MRQPLLPPHRRYLLGALIAAATVAGVALSLLTQTQAEAQAARFGEPTGVQVAVSCLAGNGRVDINMVNLHTPTSTYRIELGTLSAREIDIGAKDWGRISITGRPDGPLPLQVRQDGQLIYDQRLTIGCDSPEPPVSNTEVSVNNACRDGNGYFLIQFVNAQATRAPYVIKTESVANRSTTAAPFGASVRAVTGRFDGEFEMVVERSGTEIFRRTLTVACDQPAPTPTPTATPAPTPGAIQVDFQVKETAGVGADAYPVHAVIPFAEGSLMSTSGLRIETAAGQAIPAQFEVLNRWATSTGIRHVTAHFLADVEPFTGAGSGRSAYRLVSGVNPTPVAGVAVAQSAGSVLVDNDQVEVQIHADPFRIELPTGDLVAEFRDRNNLLQPTFDRSDMTIVVEESGPIRAVIRASAPTRTEPDGSILHGWAIRLTVVAGQSHVEVDVQLQNAALDSVKSGPLYFESFTLSVPTGVGSAANERRAELDESELADPPEGIIGSSRAALGIRQFYETWPNSVSVDTDGTLTAALFPAWSENQVHPTGNVFDDSILGANGSGLYWLEDMQAVVKEFIIDFGSPSPAAADELARLVDHPPIAVIPTNVYRSTKATLDLGGTVPESIQQSNDETARTPEYPLSAGSFWNSELSSVFFLGWDEFLAQPNRKRQPAQTGGWPDPISDFIASGDPTDYFLAADRARGELNVMPQWLPGYDFARDQNRLELTENPYNGSSWRQFLGHNSSPRRFEYLDGTGQDAKPRDDAHGWFYNVEASYYLTADPWIRDWYEFIAEFRKVRLTQGDPFPDMSGRAVGHAINHALQAYRITGDTELLDLTGSYLTNHVTPELNALGAYSNGNAQSAAWQVGYLARSVIDYIEELPGDSLPTRDPAAFDFLKRTMEWNVSIGNFDTWRPADAATPGSSWGGGLTLADPQAWYFRTSGWAPAASHLLDFVDGGVNGGQAPYGEVTDWKGSYEGRLVQQLLEDQ